MALLFGCLAAGLTGPAAAQSAPPALQAGAAVSETDVFVGESFTLQIQVSGSERPEPPDVSGLRDAFAVQDLPGRVSTARQTVYVNGREYRDERLGFVFSYLLTPRRAGALEIPAFTVRAEGRTVVTAPITVTARRPTETADFKLRQSLSRPFAYVGEPVVLTVTWYIGQDVRGFQFRVPLLEDGRFLIADAPLEGAAGRQLFRIPVAGGEVIGEKSRGRLDGKEYATLTFQRILVPREPFRLEAEPATVAAEVLVGYRQGRRPGMFGDDFLQDFFRDDFFGRGRTGVYRKLVVPSNPLAFEALPLPTEGRPRGFAGHVGEYQIEVSATPMEVNVGDPITLTIVLSGPPYVEHAQPPALAEQPDLARDFRIPAEMAPGKSDGRVKVFTQTVRALRPDVAAIPPLDLPYFNPRTAQYETARSSPISLIVRASKVVTAADAEGNEPAAIGRTVEAWARGIAHNYEDADALTDQRWSPRAALGGWAGLFLVVFPPLFFAAVRIGLAVRRLARANPEAQRARRAAPELGRRLRAVRRAANGAGAGGMAAAEVLAALREYLADRLGLPAAGAVTYLDVEGPLRERGAGAETLSGLKDLMERCEASHYAGAARDEAPAALVERAREWARRAEKELR